MKLKELCKKYDLKATDEFWATDEVELAYIYNGAGPDWLPEFGRDILTKFLELFKAAFVIHDFDFDRSDGTKKSFDEANLRMKHNMKKILNIEYPFRKFWRWITRSRWWSRAKLAYTFCDQFGWSAWVD
jgi:hypothetical protein